MQDMTPLAIVAVLGFVIWFVFFFAALSTLKVEKMMKHLVTLMEDHYAVPRSKRMFPPKPQK